MTPWRWCCFHVSHQVTVHDTSQLGTTRKHGAVVVLFLRVVVYFRYRVQHTTLTHRHPQTLAGLTSLARGNKHHPPVRHWPQHNHSHWSHLSGLLLPASEITPTTCTGEREQWVIMVGFFSKPPRTAVSLFVRTFCMG